jgi:hypothetical protein
MAADATAGRLRFAAPSTASILGIAAAGLTVTMFAACGVLLLLTRDYERAVYLGLVLLASLELPSSTPVAVAGSTLVAAALFHPVRRRVKRAVDRRFNRARYNADLILEAFAARLQDAVNLDTVRAELANAVHAAFEPTHLSIWIREL